MRRLDRRQQLRDLRLCQVAVAGSAFRRNPKLWRFIAITVSEAGPQKLKLRFRGAIGPSGRTTGFVIGAAVVPIYGATEAMTKVRAEDFP